RRRRHLRALDAGRGEGGLHLAAESGAAKGRPEHHIQRDPAAGAAAGLKSRKQKAESRKQKCLVVPSAFDFLDSARRNTAQSEKHKLCSRTLLFSAFCFLLSALPRWPTEVS